MLDQLKPGKKETSVKKYDSGGQDTYNDFSEGRKVDGTVQSRISKKIKKSIRLKGEPTIHQIKVGLNLQDREDLNNRNKEVMERIQKTKYIHPDTLEPKEEQKRLKSEVNNEVRSVGNAKSKFIEENKNQFMNVSSLNLRRAEQIR